MKVLKATLAFVLGMVLGIIVLVLAIGGTVFALGTTRTVGDIQSAVTNEQIIKPDSDLYKETVLDAVKQILEDYQNFNTLSLKLLYEHYGIDLFKGLSGLDFTQKSFYGTPITDIINDVSLLLDDIYLSDIGKLADLDFLKYNIPIINENMNVGLTTAIDNIMNLVNGDLSIRLIQDKLGLSIGAENNGILSALQDVNLKEIGGLIDALRIGTLLTVDSDAFLPKGSVRVYVSVVGTEEEWEEVSDDDLADPDYAPPLGVETYIAGGEQVTVGGETKDRMLQRELRYYQKEDGTRVVDNTCYNQEWNKPEGVTVVRHRLYKPFEGNGSANGEYYVETFVNHIESIDPLTGNIAFLHKGFTSLDDIYVAGGAKIDKTLVKNGKLDLSSVSLYNLQKAEEEGGEDSYVESPEFSVLDERPTSNSQLRVPDEKYPYIAGRQKFLRAHLGASSGLLQYLNNLSIGDVRNDTDSILKNVRIGDIIDTDEEGVAEFLKALKDSTLDSIGEDINTLKLGQIIDVDKEGTASVLKALRDSSLDTIGEDLNRLKLGEIINVGDSPLLQALQNSTLDSIAGDVETLELGQIITVDATSPKIMQALVKRHATLSTISDVVSDLTVGELMDITWDEYALDADGDYVREYYYTDFNPYLDFSDYGDGAVRCDGPEADYALNPEGQYVKTYYYVLYDAASHPGRDRFRLVTEGETALAIQSLARRGYKALEMGDHIDDLSMGELIRITPDSAYLFKSLARKGSNLNSIAEDANTLEIGDIIEITDESSQIMISLARRKCTLANMDKITDKLTLEEILEIVPDRYTPDANGYYVHVLDPEGYIPYDPENSDHVWRKKFVENEDGTGYRAYEAATDEGKAIFVHSAYYTLYNPAQHTADNPNLQKDGDGVARFDRTEAEGASSQILQRFSGATMGSFSSAFSDIMLSDVMDIKGDIYAPVAAEEIKYQDGYGYYYGESFETGKVLYLYDEANGIYAVADQNDMKDAQSGSLTLYKVDVSGESPTILKKLAYVKVDNLANALDAIMKDMVLSELIDIHVYDAVDSLTPYDPSDTVAANYKNKRFFIKWDGKSTVNDKPIVHVYDSTGKYMARDDYYYPINESDPADVSEYLGSGTQKTFVYKQCTSGGLTTQASKNNLYVKKDDEFVYNIALTTYYVAQAAKLTLEGKQTEANEIAKKMYYREFSESPVGDDATGTGMVYTTIENVFVDKLGEKVAYDPSNPAHCGLQKYAHLTKKDGKFIVPIDGGSKDKYKEGVDIKIGTKYANDVMLKQSSLEEAKRAAAGNEFASVDEKYGTVYVFLPGTNSYEPYDEHTLGHNQPDTQYYIMSIGYVAQFGEVFVTERPDESKCSTHLTFQIADVPREHSSKVLMLLANRTIKDMDSAISTATISDFMEVTPGTIFDGLGNATINGLGTAIAASLSHMTIGQLLEWGSITAGTPEVRAALNDVTLTAFFDALEYNATSGTISLNMEKLYT